MAILGMRGSGSWVAGQQPTNFREKILYLYPNSPAILTAITGKLKSEVVNDPTFTIFEKGLPPHRARIEGIIASGTTQIDLSQVGTGGASATPSDIYRPGQVAMIERTQEVIWITTIASTTALTVVRGDNVGSTSAATVDGDYLLIIGNHNAEGAATPQAQSTNPETSTNYTQIWRTAMSLTGTAKETYLRTGEVEKELKREAAERHAIEMEWSFIFGRAKQTTTGGYYDRTTGGVLSFLEGTDANRVDFAGAVSKDGWEAFLEDLFSVPSGGSEKMCLCGNRALTTLNAMAQAYGQIDLTPTSESYGMKFSRYETPYGTLQLKAHPLLSQNPTFSSWGIIIDPKNIVYRPLKNRDTKFLLNRQSPGDDAIVHEFLTEAGLELRHVPTHGIFMNASAFTP